MKDVMASVSAAERWGDGGRRGRDRYCVSRAVTGWRLRSVMALPGTVTIIADVAQVGVDGGSAGPREFTVGVDTGGHSGLQIRTIVDDQAA